MRTITYATLLAGLQLRENNASSADKCAQWLTAASKSLWETAMPVPETVQGKAVNLTGNVLAYADIGNGSFYRVFSADPRIPDQAYCKIKATNDGDGIHCRTQLSSVFVLYRPAAPRYTNTAYNNSSAYAVDALVLYTDGNVYRCLTATSAGENPVSTPAKWQLQPVLLCMEEALKTQARGEVMLDVSSGDRAAAYFERAESLLEEQWFLFASRFPYAVEQP